MGQRAGSDDGRHSFGSCCLEDVVAILAQVTEKNRQVILVA